MIEDDPKYIVRKAGSTEKLEPGTYFVIRQQDLFAAPAMYGYSHLVQTVLELSRIRPGTLTVEEVDQLTTLVDELGTLAYAWQMSGRKIPT